MMSETERTQRVTYHACRHAIAAVDEKLARKSSAPFKDALQMERQSYVDLANEITEAVDGLQSVK